jgi:hypothetical protein
VGGVRFRLSVQDLFLGTVDTAIVFVHNIQCMRDMIPRNLIRFVHNYVKLDMAGV